MSSNPKGSVYLENTDDVQKVFNRFDTNGDGKISADELGGVLVALGSASSESEIAQMMNEIDTDKDGYISLEELASFCSKGSGDEKELREAFDKYDEDGDGRISAVELHQILTRLGEHCSVEDCESMIGSVDEDGDGYVAFHEFRNMKMNTWLQLSVR